MLSGKAKNTNFIIFDLTRPGLEPTIYRTRGEHANHNTTDTVADWDDNGPKINEYVHVMTIINFTTVSRFFFSYQLNSNVDPSISVLTY